MTATVTAIMDAVRQQGDSALRDFSMRFDGVEESVVGPGKDWPLRVPHEVMQAAWETLDAALKDALVAASRRIRAFHQAQTASDVIYRGPDGEELGITWRSLRRIGVYAPGGRAAYPSTVLMDVIPAQVAGVDEIVLVSPPTKETGLPHTLVLAAAYLTGITEVYRVGGAQAIAALTYGTQSIPPVDKIVGPGNIYVATAKRLVMGSVGIDSIAGPSEVFIIADSTAPAALIAADLLAQAEHDFEAGAVAIVPSTDLADAVEAQLTRQLTDLPKREICEAALEKWGAIVLADSVSEAVEVANRSAPEHLELLVANPETWLPRIRTAGAVFLGVHSPEPVGDYYAGTNHVLPTHGSARYASGLGVHDFMRRMSYVSYEQDTLRRHAPHIMALAAAEGLHAHARSIAIRMDRGEIT